MTIPVLAGRNLDKSFGPVVALKTVGIALEAGRVSAIVGENGAGKSTLAKILAGILAADGGELLVNGAPAFFRSRADAIAAGIGFVPQSLSFINTLTLAENHLLARPGFYADRAVAIRELAPVAEELGIDVPYDVQLERLSLPQRQLGEIVSTVASGARVLLLDEPTSSLGPLEIANLTAAIRRLAGTGTAVGLVTHRINEVLSGADHVTVLRGGEQIFDGPTAGIDADGIARLMVGSTRRRNSRPPEPGEAVKLSVEGITFDADGVRILDDISFTLRAGEIVGLAGVASTGQTILAEILAGLRSPTGGRVIVAGSEVTGRAAEARASGLVYIPDERAAGIVPTLTVAENASLFRLDDQNFSRAGLRRPQAELAHAERIIHEWDVRPQRPDIAASSLSGGNQQKLLVGRELDGQPAVVVAHGPTQGLDIAASATIRERLIDAARNAAAVLIISADLDEILSISHRIVVLSGGRIADTLALGDGPPDMVRLGRAIGGNAARRETTQTPETIMNAPAPRQRLEPLIGRAFPPHGLTSAEEDALVILQRVLDDEIAPRAAANDASGRYPTESIAALKRTGILASAIPRALGGLEFSHRASIEAQVRIAAADSAVSQIFKIHEECLREAVVNIPDATRADLARAVVNDRKIIGLAVAEAGRRVDDPMTTVFVPDSRGGGVIDGKKIYTTGAAEADLIAVWSFDPTAPGVSEAPVLGLRVHLVPAGTPGITVHRDWDALGQRATDSGSITFAALHVEPAWNALAPGRFPINHGPLLWQLGFAANLIGNAVGAVKAAVPFVNTRSRPWPSAGTESAADDPYVRRLTGEIVADLAAAYALTLATADLLDAIVRGEIDRTTLAIPVYAAKSAASRAAVRATSEIFALMGTRSTARANGFDRYWRNARTISLHDPVEWKSAEIGRHVLTGWEPPWGVYQ